MVRSLANGRAQRPGRAARTPDRWSAELWALPLCRKPEPWAVPPTDDGPGRCKGPHGNRAGPH